MTSNRMRPKRARRAVTVYRAVEAVEVVTRDMMWGAASMAGSPSADGWRCEGPPRDLLDPAQALRDAARLLGVTEAEIRNRVTRDVWQRPYAEVVRERKLGAPPKPNRGPRKHAESVVAKLLGVSEQTAVDDVRRVADTGERSGEPGAVWRLAAESKPRR